MKKILTVFTLMMIGMFSSFASAQQTDISIIPKWWDVWNIVKWVSQWGKVWDNYRAVVKSGNLSLWDQFASWILSWDSILDYLVFLVKFVGQVALLIGALAIIYLGYKRIIKNLKPESNNPIWKIVLWLLIIVFAYVIVKLIWSAFIS